MFSYIVVIISFLSRYVNAPDKKKERNINIHLIDFNKTLTTNSIIQIELQFWMITIHILFDYSDVIYRCYRFS